MTQISDVAGEASRTDRPVIRNHYHNSRVYNPYRQNLDSYRTGWSRVDSATELPTGTEEVGDVNRTQILTVANNDDQDVKTAGQGMAASASPGSVGCAKDRRGMSRRNGSACCWRDIALVLTPRYRKVEENDIAVAPIYVGVEER